jgi:hypothetical protein
VDHTFTIHLLLFTCTFTLIFVSSILLQLSHGDICHPVRTEYGGNGRGEFAAVRTISMVGRISGSSYARMYMSEHASFCHLSVVCVVLEDIEIKHDLSSKIDTLRIIYEH